ncbi:MAG: GNAT family N-acetyltransferase [Acidimicrobiales bacterium]
MSVTVEIAVEVTEELVTSLNQLLPQLSSNAAPLSAAEVEALVTSPATVVFVARDDGRIVGSLTLVVFSIPTGLRAWIEDVVVDEPARGKGVGEALTNAAIEESRRRKVRSIDLTTRPSREAANRLYARLGFELRQTNVYRLSVERSDDD